MTWLSTIAGAVLIAVAVRDMFQTLWHPPGFGGVTRVVFQWGWRLLRRIRVNRRTGLGGPLCMVVTGFVWGSLLVTGFMLIYLPRMPEQFAFNSALDPYATPDLVHSLYLSLVAVSTLGLGDVVPTTPFLRLLVPVQTLLGFIFFTAIISWVLQLYPALTRRKALARRMAAMTTHDTAGVLPEMEHGLVVELLEGLRGDLALIEMDLRQYSESYYFREIDLDIALSGQLPTVLTLVEAAEASPTRDVQHAGTLLRDGLEHLAALLRKDFLPASGPGLSETLAAYAKDHDHQEAVRRLTV